MSKKPQKYTDEMEAHLAAMDNRIRAIGRARQQASPVVARRRKAEYATKVKMPLTGPGF